MTEVTVRQVHDDASPLERLALLLGPERAERLREQADRGRRSLGDRTVWNVGATTSVDRDAEMLFSLLAPGSGSGPRAGVEARSLVIDAGPAFFRITKRMHNFLRGAVGDAGRLAEAERQHYETVLATNLTRLAGRVRRGDLVLLQDPAAAGLAPGLRGLGAHVIWLSHVATGVANRAAEMGWSFLRPYVEAADAVVFPRGGCAPRWLNPYRTFVIPPALDPSSPRNRELTSEQVEATLRSAGIVAGNVGDRFRDFARGDGSPGRVRRHSGVTMSDELLPAGERYVLQVGHWDRLEDAAGVLAGFASALARMPSDVHLVLAGPRPEVIAHDPESTHVAQECVGAWQQLPAYALRRIHICWLPSDDPDEHDHIVNALQRRADLVVHKSIAEDFGLTVAESMWKGRAVLASRVGGIPDQVVDCESGVLLDDSRDVDSFGAAVATLMRDAGLRDRLGVAARERVGDRFLGDRLLAQYVELVAALLD
jgi:trehalose synthase